MFYQFLPFSQDMEFRFTLECDQRLHGTLSLNYPWLNLLKKGDHVGLSKFDFQFPAGGLLKKFSNKLGKLKNYCLRAFEDQRVVSVLKKYDFSEKSMVGLSWLSMNQEHGFRRSVQIEKFCEYLDPKKHVILNLQYLLPDDE
jgi:hypothetical protein